MAYLGNAPARSFISFERQVFTIVNSQTAYTLDHSVNNENDIRLVINNIVQEPGSGKAYTASGTTLTLSAALVNGTDEMYCVFLGRAVATNKPGAGSVGTTELAADAVTEAKIADDAVESEHLNNNVISGQTELASTPDDTDEFLISDGGTIKRIDYSYLKGETNTPAFFAGQTSGQSISNTSFTKLNFDTEDFDTDSGFASNQFTVPSGKAGRYFLHAVATGDGTNNFDRQHLAIYVDGSSPSVAGSTDRYSNLNVPSGGGYNTVSTSLILNLSAGAVVSVYYYQDSGGSITTYEPRTYFMGYRIITT